jgi:ribulose kinase
LITHSSQDSTLLDLARKFHLTLEAIALQTRHIVDEMNAHGHAVRSIYVSGSQAKNRALMALLANCCNMPVVLPPRPGAAVVLGAAMLGRFAAEAGQRGHMSNNEQAEALWKSMVSDFHLLCCIISHRPPG